MELCWSKGEIYWFRQVPGMEERRSAQKEYMDPGIWEIFVNYKDLGWILFSAAELEGK